MSGNRIPGVENAEESQKKGRGIGHAFRKKVGQAVDTVVDVLPQKTVNMYETEAWEIERGEQLKQEEERQKKALGQFMAVQKEKAKEEKSKKKEEKSKKNKREKPTKGKLNSASENSSSTQSTGSSSVVVEKSDLKADSSSRSSTPEMKPVFAAPPPSDDIGPPPSRGVPFAFSSQTVSQAPSAFSQAIAETAAAKNAREAGVSKLQAEIEALRKQNAQLQQQAKDQKDEADRAAENVRHKVKDLEEKNQGLTIQNQSLTTTVAAKEADIHVLQIAAEQWDKEKTELQNQVTVAEDQLAAKDRKIAEVQAEVAEGLEEIENLKNDSEAKEKEKVKLQLELGAKKLAVGKLKNVSVDNSLSLLDEKIRALENGDQDGPNQNFAQALREQYRLIEENKEDSKAIAVCIHTCELIDGFKSAANDNDKKTVLGLYEKQCGVLSLSQKILRGVATVLIAAVGVIVGAVIGIGVGAIIGSVGGPVGGAVGALLGMFQGAVTGLGIGITVAAAVTGVAAGTGAGVAFFKPGKFEKGAKDAAKYGKEMIDAPKPL